MEYFDKLALEWDNNPERVERAKVAAEFIKKHVPYMPGMSAFEYGCGTGLLSFNLTTHFTKIVLGDSSQGMLDVLSRKIELTKIKNMFPLKTDLSSDTIEENAFDAIFTQLTLHHIQNYKPILDKFVTMLKVGGYLSIIDLDKEDGSFHGEDFIGHNGFDRKELYSTLEKRCFSMIRDELCFEIIKETIDGQKRAYPVFILTTKKV